MALFALAYSSHILWYWPLGRTEYHHTSLSSALLSQELPILPDIFPRNGKGNHEADSTRCFWLPSSLIMPPGMQIRFGDEAMWRKIWLFTKNCFHDEFLEFQSYSRYRNHFDVCSKQTHSEENQVIPIERFSDVMKTFCFDFWWKIWSDIWLVTKGLNFNLRIIENRLSTKMWRTQGDIWLVIKGWNFNLRVIENRL